MPFFLFGLLFLPFFSFSQTRIPVIHRADLSDSAFLQLIFDRQNSYQKAQQGKPLPRLHLFAYTVQPGDDFYKLAAQFNTDTATLASLNLLSNADDLHPGMPLLLCNRKGLFIPDFPTQEFLPVFIRHSRLHGETEPPSLTVNGKRWFFLENESFSASEQAFFLKILYRYPLSHGVMTSDYGRREDPINHRASWHKGIDLAAPFGAEVFAANSGTVSDSGTDDVYGNYILLSHPNGFQTFYAHLSRIGVTPFAKVHAGEAIGNVGDSGRATGAHLHFEIRRKGQTIDPKTLIRLK